MSEMGMNNNGGEMLTDEDLLTEVLCRLPVKYILRCKAVSKTWHSLISNPSFVKSHHQFNRTGDNKVTTLIVQLPDEDDYPETNDGSYSLFQLGGGSDDFIAHLKFPFSKGDYPSIPFSRLIGCDSSIVCIFVFKFRDIYLWNPATKQSKLIPPHTQYDNLQRTRYGFTGAGEIKQPSGFGFDPISFDFKVVRVVSPPIYSDKVCPSILFSEVYSAERDAWREIEADLTDFPKEIIFYICLRGFLFATGNNGMIAFNLNKEVFICDIKLPVSSNDARIADFKDSICVIISKCEEVGEKINLWTLDDEACLHGGGAKASWTFKLSIDVGVRFDCVQGFFNSVEFLLEADGLVSYADGWFSYNSDNKVGRYINPDPFCFFYEVFQYRESLLSVAGSKLVQWSDDEDINEESRVGSEDDNEEPLPDSEDNEKSNINEEGCIESEDNDE